MSGDIPKLSAKTLIPQRRMTAFRRLMIWVYCASFAFDFKGEESGGNVAQYLMLFLALASFTLLLLTKGPKLIPASQSLRRAIFLWMGYIGITLITCTIYTSFEITDVSFFRYSRVIIPYLMFGMSLLVVDSLRSDDILFHQLLVALFVTAVFSSAWRYIYATRIASIAVLEMRYQILSPAIAFLIATGCIELILSRNPSFFRLAVMMAAVCMILMSITRSYLLVLMVCLLGCSWVAWNNRRRNPLFTLARLKAFFVVVVLTFAGLAILVALRPNVIESWEDRLFHHAGGKTERDLTLMTREAEALGLWEAIWEDPVFVLVGRGVGASYSWHPSYDGELRRVLHDGGETEIWSLNHSMWTYSFFSSGFIFGPIVLIAFLYPLVKGLYTASRYAKFPGVPLPRTFVLPPMTLLSYMSLSFTANPFAERYSGLIMGLCAGMIYSNDRLTIWAFSTSSGKQSGI